MFVMLNKMMQNPQENIGTNPEREPARSADYTIAKNILKDLASEELDQANPVVLDYCVNKLENLISKVS